VNPRDALCCACRDLVPEPQTPGISLRCKCGAVRLSRNYSGDGGVTVWARPGTAIEWIEPSQYLKAIDE